MSDYVPHDCPTCGSHRIGRIVYGLVDVTKLADDLASGRIVLGGCTVSKSSHRWCCNSCGSQWGDFAAEFEQREREDMEEQVRRDARARARGVMEAPLYPDGWARCPHCGYSFNSKARMSWDGEKHITCGTYLRLLPSVEMGIAAGLKSPSPT